MRIVYGAKKGNMLTGLLIFAAIGYKTPLSLLSERCQKSGWDRPSVDPKKGTLPNSWTASVTLKRKNPKSGDFETVYMRPPPRRSPLARHSPRSTFR